MGRAMLIICSGVLITMGIVNINTSKHGNLLAQKTVNYADFTMAKNTAHTAIQIAMQEINDDESFLTTYTEDNPWNINIGGRDVKLYVETINNVTGNEYWDTDSLRIVSKATQTVAQGDFSTEVSAEVASIFLKERFSTLVPEFEGAMSFAADQDKFTFSGGGSASISGHSPSPCKAGQASSKPGVTVKPGGENNMGDINNLDVDADPKVKVNEDLSYQPTDELIERLSNAPGTTYLTGDWSGPLGTAEDPGVFFVEDHMKLNGKQSEGYGILVVRKDATIAYDGEDESGASLTVNGNFEWNGLIIFEDAYDFSGKGTPQINGSILVGHTEKYNGAPIDIDISGNIHFQYDCKGEDYAKMAAADAVQQNKYTRVVTTEISNQLRN